MPMRQFIDIGQHKMTVHHPLPDFLLFEHDQVEEQSRNVLSLNEEMMKVEEQQKAEASTGTRTNCTSASKSKKMSPRQQRMLAPTMCLEELDRKVLVRNKKERRRGTNV